MKLEIDRQTGRQVEREIDLKTYPGNKYYERIKEDNMIKDDFALCFYLFIFLASGGGAQRVGERQ